jgi:RecA/RadA recombinase
MSSERSRGSSPGPAPTHLTEAAALALDHALGQEPTLGAGRLICVDGPAGSGKTTLADVLVTASARRVTSSGLLHMDDLYEGWSGLGPALSERVHEQILVPLAAGEPGRYRRWDWYADAWAEAHVVDPVALLVLEGVGSAATTYDELVTTRVWVDAPRDLRLDRGLARGDYGDPEHWLRWLDLEAEVLDHEDTRSRADVLVDGTGAAPPVRRSRQV